ncbi:predicted protein [Plenodomus lingam JN3]|uniref:Uncharacterized protein n=1 Tax=Leptosphaeria maculans (strain JN3 / isolate v23.1.3 / race Av1-4-5-6-7-8) TaxID=985895 RepID=E5A7H8_LEPMJ|nr:predicted protein [Plenodomus lingam JN3]CBX99573.1 predicted protein [Plenodomus lingam JN3]
MDELIIQAIGKLDLCSRCWKSAVLRNWSAVEYDVTGSSHLDALRAKSKTRPRSTKEKP